MSKAWRAFGIMSSRYRVAALVGHAAVQHPIALSLGDEFDVAGLRDTDQDGVLGIPKLLRNSSPFGTGNRELVSVQMNGMVVHAQVDHADLDPFTLLH